jgi:hypothetical protein
VQKRAVERLATMRSPSINRKFDAKLPLNVYLLKRGFKSGSTPLSGVGVV